MPPETVLAFDTSAAHCAAALLLADGTVVLRHEDMAKGQAERLVPLLEDLLSDAGLGWRDLTRLAVGTGPGNFTGVRIAVAAARGLALGLGLPAVGVTTLRAIAHGRTTPVLVAQDARRGMAYVQMFGPDQPAALVTAGTVPGDTLPPDGTLCLGDLAPLYAERFGLEQAAPLLPLTQAMALIARDAPPGQPRPAPFYLRSADAAPPSDPPPVILP